jgi:hypothetical protein
MSSTTTAPTFVQAFPNMLGKEYCRIIIERFEQDDRREPSTVGRLDKRIDEGRTGTILFLNDTMAEWKDVVVQTHTAVEKAVREYAAQFPALAGHSASGRVGCRYPRIERVDPGQGFDWHADNANAETAERVLACLLYLSDIDDGGHTEFEHQNIKVKPEAGKVVVFPPFWTHLHRGASPGTGAKYTMSFFWAYLDGPDPRPEKLTWRQRLTGKI